MVTAVKFECDIEDLHCIIILNLTPMFVVSLDNCEMGSFCLDFNKLIQFHQRR